MSNSRVILNFRKHQDLFVNSNDLTYIEKEKIYNSSDIAILVIGMWNTHQCKVASSILNEMAPRINDFLNKSRSHGMKIIFGSSSLTKMNKYKPLVNNMKNIPYYHLKDKGLSFPPLPFDVGNDGGVVEYDASFNRSSVDIHPIIEIKDSDAMSDNCKEILNYLYFHQIKLCLVLGAHTNMCIIDRPYGIKNLARFGFPLAIVRDLTDPLVNPDGVYIKDRVDALNKVVQYIEKNFAPSIDSRDLMIINPGKKVIRVDIDDTICIDDEFSTSNDKHPYKIKKPILETIKYLNNLYLNGNTIIYWSSRGVESGKDWLDFTRNQLESWGVLYSGIICGKPKFDIFIDDKAYNSISYFKSNLII